MKSLTFLYIHPTDFGRPLTLKMAVDVENPIVWLEDPRFLLHASSWIEGAHGIRPWLSRRRGNTATRTELRREWIQLDAGERPRVVVCPGAASFRTATAFAAAHGLPHVRAQLVPEGDGWRWTDAPQAPVEAFHFPIELRDLQDPLELAPIVRDFPWPAGLFGLSYGKPGTWFHVAHDGATVSVPARARGMMTDVPVDRYGWYGDPGTGPLLHAVLSVVVEPADLWKCEAELARRLRDWAHSRPAHRSAPIAVGPKPRQLARQLEAYRQNLEPVAGVTLLRTVAAGEPVAARLEELARGYGLLEDFEHAVDLLEAALRLEPDNLGLITHQLRLRIAAGDLDRAAADLENARRRHTDLSLDLLAFTLATSRGERASSRGERATSRGEPDSALALGRAVAARIATGDGKKMDRRQRLDFHLTFAGVCLATGALDDGVAAANAALKLEQDHPGAYFLGALLMCGLHQWEDALEALERAQSCGDISSRIKFVEILARIGCDQMEEALEAARVCGRRIADELVTDPDDGPILETRMLLAGLLHEEEPFTETVAALSGAEISPECRFQIRLLCDLDPDYRNLHLRMMGFKSP